jgi:hypothetical protein
VCYRSTDPSAAIESPPHLCLGGGPLRLLALSVSTEKSLRLLGGRPPSCPQRLLSGAQRTAARRDHWPAGRAQALALGAMAPRAKMTPGAPSPGRVQRPSVIAKTPHSVCQPFCCAPISAPRPSPWGPGPPAVALCSGLSQAHATKGFSSIRPRSAGADRTPPTARARTPRARARLAFVLGGRGAAGRARRAMPGGRHPESRPGGPAPVCYPQSTEAMLGLAPLSILLRGATPTGGPAHSRQHPGPPRPRRRRRGRALSRASQPPWAPAPRTATQNHPGQPWDSARAAVAPLPAPRGPRQTRP